MRFNTFDEFESFLVTNSTASSDWYYLKQERKYRFKKDLNITIEVLYDDINLSANTLPSYPFAGKIKSLLETKYPQIIDDVPEFMIQLKQDNNVIIDFNAYSFRVFTPKKLNIQDDYIILPEAIDIHTLNFSPLQKSIIKALNQNLNYIRSILTVD